MSVPGIGFFGFRRPAPSNRSTRPTGDDVPDVRVERGGAHTYQDVAGAGRGLVDVVELQLVRSSVPLLDDRLHRAVNT